MTEHTVARGFKKKWFGTRGLNYVFTIGIGFVCCHIINLVLPQFFSNVLFGASSSAYPFTFQMFMWIPFFYALEEVYMRYEHYGLTRHHFQTEYLPSGERIIFDSRGLAEILTRLRESVHLPGAYAPRLFQQVILKFQSSKSVDQASSMMSSVLDSYLHKLDLSYAKIRYIAWLLPTLGFIGTVYGISLTVAEVGKASPDDPTLLNTIASNLAVAFDTTLLALVQSSILLLLSNSVESKEESLMNRLGQYTLEKLINRLP